MKNRLRIFILCCLVSLSIVGCQEIDLVSELDQNKSKNSELALKAANISYNITVTGPTAILLKGNSITITTNSITDSFGKVYANQTVGVDDGLKQYCTTTKTDKYGKINYSTKVNTTGVGIVTFIINNQRYSFIFQTASKKSGSTYYTTGLNYTSLKLKNTNSKDLKLSTKLFNGTNYTQRLKANTTQTVIAGKKPTKAKRVTAFVGGTYIVGLGVGGNVSATLDTNGVIQTSIAAGFALLRFQAYGTSSRDVGACWAPGGDFGVSPIAVSGEATLCLGTDGINVGLSAGSGYFVGGSNINIYQW